MVLSGIQIPSAGELGEYQLRQTDIKKNVFTVQVSYLFLVGANGSKSNSLPLSPFLSLSLSLSLTHTHTQVFTIV